MFSERPYPMKDVGKQQNDEVEQGTQETQGTQGTQETCKDMKLR
jgi:hypothetical protein